MQVNPCPNPNLGTNQCHYRASIAYSTLSLSERDCYQGHRATRGLAYRARMTLSMNERPHPEQRQPKKTTVQTPVILPTIPNGPLERNRRLAGLISFDPRTKPIQRRRLYPNRAPTLEGVKLYLSEPLRFGFNGDDCQTESHALSHHTLSDLPATEFRIELAFCCDRSLQRRVLQTKFACLTNAAISDLSSNVRLYRAIVTVWVRHEVCGCICASRQQYSKANSPYKFQKKLQWSTE